MFNSYFDITRGYFSSFFIMFHNFSSFFIIFQFFFIIFHHYSSFFMVQSCSTPFLRGELQRLLGSENLGLRHLHLRAEVEIVDAAVVDHLEGGDP